MECYFASYSKSRSEHYWKTNGAKPLLELLFSRYQSIDYLESVELLDTANEFIENDVAQLIPEIKTTLSTMSFDTNWGPPISVADFYSSKQTVDIILNCRIYLTEEQIKGVTELKVKRDAYLNKITKELLLTKKSSVPRLLILNKDEVQTSIASLDLDQSSISTSSDIEFNLLDYFSNYFNLELQPNTNHPTKSEILRLYSVITPTDIQNISQICGESIPALTIFLEELKPVVVDLKATQDSEFLLIGDAIDPENFNIYFENRVAVITKLIKGDLTEAGVVVK